MARAPITSALRAIPRGSGCSARLSAHGRLLGDDPCAPADLSRDHPRHLGADRRHHRRHRRGHRLDHQDLFRRPVGLAGQTEISGRVRLRARRLHQADLPAGEPSAGWWRRASSIASARASAVPRATRSSPTSPRRIFAGRASASASRSTRSARFSGRSGDRRDGDFGQLYDRLLDHGHPWLLSFGLIVAAVRGE